MALTVDTSVGDTPAIDTSTIDAQLASQQAIAEWQIKVTAVTNALESEKDAHLAVARNQ
jgi:hypothetical protein